MSTSSPPPHPPPPQTKNKQIPTVITGCSFFFALLHCLRNEKRTTPSSDSDSNPPHPFSYSLLRRATNSFSNILGHGGFGPVYSGTLPSSGKLIAVKLMNSTSSVAYQGEREYHNELFFAARLHSDLLVPAIGFSSDPKRRRFLLVYDLMKNGNLHDGLFRRKSPELTLWKTRFSIILDIAKGIQYLHSCDPPIIHGDIKPSNILLDHSFSAKIADFGLARLKTLSPFEIRKEEFESDETEIESVNTSLEEYETDMVGVVGGRNIMKKSGSVKDYVMDWIGKEVKKESSKNGELVGGSGNGKGEKSKKKMEWWESMDDGNGNACLKKKEKRRPAREWWKEEYSQELANKNKKKTGGKNGDNWWKWERDRDDVDAKKQNSKNRNRKDRGSDDSWLSGELKRVNWNSYDSCNSGEICKSGEISSTASMRGTVFYVAPENGYSGGGDVTEKCDVYSFGVLLLVIVSGRRPLQVNDGLHVSEFKRANLVSWARHCGRNGKLIELVDPCVELLLVDHREQALLCIKVALVCLMKSPNRRPSMKQVVGMLSGELEPPQLPHERSQTRFQFKNRKESL
ncbi:unnamed protein product [Lathyrus sativus]|nr:unnamed protein product [Lathyrus sativus]